jgi:DNA-binding MarR family transcriptional regulator
MEIHDLWRDINRGTHERFREFLRGLALPPMVVGLVPFIHHTPGITVSELARKSGTVKSHVSKIVEQLVAEGMAEKRPDPDDQRLQRIYLTQAAIDKKVEFEARIKSVWADVTAHIPEPQLQTVVEGLRILAGALESTGRPAPMSDPDPSEQ